MAVSGTEEIDMADITIRRSNGHDQEAIDQLAGLDSQRAPDGRVLLAFDGDELVAALPLEGGRPIADPFHRTAEIVDLLTLRAAQGEMPASVRRERHLRRLGLAEGSSG
jgi:hypothetical protein